MYNDLGFMAYSYHREELERIIREMVYSAERGIYDTPHTTEYLTSADWEYIEREVQKRI